VKPSPKKSKTVGENPLPSGFFFSLVTQKIETENIKNETVANFFETVANFFETVANFFETENINYETVVNFFETEKINYETVVKFLAIQYRKLVLKNVVKNKFAHLQSVGRYKGITAR